MSEGFNNNAAAGHYNYQTEPLPPMKCMPHVRS